MIIGPNGQKTELLIIILYGASVTSAATTASGQRSLVSRPTSLSAHDPLCESCSPSQMLLATLGHILLKQCLLIPVQTFLLLPSIRPTTVHPLSLPVPLQLLQIQFHNVHLTSPPPSLLLKCRPPLPLPAPLPSLCLR